MPKQVFGMTPETRVEYTPDSFFYDFSCWETRTALTVNADVDTSASAFSRDCYAGYVRRTVQTNLRLAYDFANRVETRLYELDKQFNRKHRVILGGRDCFLTFCALMKKTSFPRRRLVFVPELSRNTANSWPALRAIVNFYHLTPDDYYVDTGFRGSIFDRLARLFEDNHNILRSSLDKAELLSCYNHAPYKHLLKVNHECLRDAVIHLEDTPKHWDSAYASADKVVQRVNSEPDSFTEASFYFHSIRRGQLALSRWDAVDEFRGYYNAIPF